MKRKVGFKNKKNNNSINEQYNRELVNIKWKDTTNEYQKYKSMTHRKRYIRKNMNWLQNKNKSRIIGAKNKSNTTKEIGTSAEEEIKYHKHHTHNVTIIKN